MGFKAISKNEVFGKVVFCQIITSILSTFTMTHFQNSSSLSGYYTARHFSERSS